MVAHGAVMSVAVDAWRCVVRVLTRQVATRRLLHLTRSLRTLERVSWLRLRRRSPALLLILCRLLDRHKDNQPFWDQAEEDLFDKGWRVLRIHCIRSQRLARGMPLLHRDGEAASVIQLTLLWAA